MVREIQKTFPQISLSALLCIHLQNETRVPPKTLWPQMTTPFSQYLRAPEELSFHGTTD
jgi:hypothetical protein